MLDWLLFALLLLAAAIPLARRLKSPLAWIVTITLYALTIAGAHFWQRDIHQRADSDQRLQEKTPHQGRPGGFIGSTACRACHPDEYDSWHRSYHRTMTQFASPVSVRGNFDNVELAFHGEHYSLSKEGDEFWVEMPDPDWSVGQAMQRRAYQSGRSAQPPPPGPAPRARKRIGLLTGSHHMQSYWVPSSDGNEQINFPFTYLFDDQRWVPRNAIFIMPPNRPPLQQIWNDNCINCHTTGGQSRRDPDTKISDSRVGEMGISCEACHGPAEEHRRVHSNPLRRYRQHQSNQPDPTIVNPDRQTTKKASESCSQCHSIRYNDQENWNEDGFHFRPGGDLDTDRPLPNHAKLAINHQLPPAEREDLILWTNSFWMDGMVRVSGREFNGLANSPCYERGELSCLSCHSMHDSDPNDQLKANMDGNAACVQCHQSIGNDLQTHTRHQPGSSGSLCYNCHMPHTSYGLLTAMRSHQIDSPTVESSINTGRPNACNLCHLDKTLQWTAQHLPDWNNQPAPQLTGYATNTSASLVWLLSGDAGQRALIAWHMGWGPAREASGEDWIAPYLTELLMDPYDAVRYIAHRSLKRLPGYSGFEYDYIARAPDRFKSRRQALDIWTAQPKKTGAPRPNILLDPLGQLDRNKVQSLLRERNNRSMHLWE